MQAQLERLPAEVSREEALQFLGVTEADEPIEFSREAQLSETYKFPTTGSSEEESSTWFLTLGTQSGPTTFSESPEDRSSEGRLISVRIWYKENGQTRLVSPYFLRGKLVD